MLAYFLLGFPRDVPGQSWTGRPVVPLSQDKGRSKNPGTNFSVPGRPGTKSLSPQKNKKQEKDVLKQEKDVLKQERMF